MKVGRYLRLLGVSARASAMTSMQYRVDFIIEGLMSVWWLGWNLVPLLVLYGERDVIAGDWDFPSALVVIGWFTVLRGILEGAITPSLIDVIDRIRTGAFDYPLLKPADAQFLVSTSRFAPWRIVDILGGIGLVIYAFARMGRTPAATDVALALALLASAALVLYSLWILVISAAFWVVRMDNLAYLFSAVFDAARWPVQVFRGAWRFLFTFIIPLALMTTYPAMALLGSIRAETALLSLAGALVFGGLARGLWTLAIRNYTSASS
ncbi:MAG TPA: ABC-2 family transporter protein [Kofleriaceae bacterium]|nr:ABC-2 family transporter protein [Kofleriaceae bacterium]